MDLSVFGATLPSATRLRPATDADGAAIARLIATIFTEYPGCHYEAEEFPELTAVASHFAAHNGHIWVVEKNVTKAAPSSAQAARELIACCAITPTSMPGRFELKKVYVETSWRGSGLAQHLIAVAIGRARAQGAQRIELFSDTRFLAAHRFYQKLGFVQLPGERYLADISQSWEYHFIRDIAAPPSGVTKA